MPLIILQTFFQKIHFILLIIAALLLLSSFQVSTDKFHFKERPKNQTVIIGSNILLECSIAQIDAPFEIQWYTNKERILSYIDSDIIPGLSGRYKLVIFKNLEFV